MQTKDTSPFCDVPDQDLERQMLPVLSDQKKVSIFQVF